MKNNSHKTVIRLANVKINIYKIYLKLKNWSQRKYTYIYKIRRIIQDEKQNNTTNNLIK